MHPEPMNVDSTSMGPAFNEIIEMAVQRQSNQAPLLEQMREIRDRYNGDVIYPWADNMAEEIPSLTPHLVGESIDNYGMRAASVPMGINCPPLYAGKEKGMGSREWARTRQLAMAATLHRNRWSLIMRKFYRHLAGYSSASIVVLPDFISNMPRVHVVNPLTSFPDPRSHTNFADPQDMMFISGYSSQDLVRRFPICHCNASGPVDPHDNYPGLWDVITYINKDVTVVGLAGRRREWDTRRSAEWNQNTTYALGPSYAFGGLEISRTVNHTGMVPGVSLGKVTLDRMSSALTHIIGQLDWAAKLQLLNVEAAEKAIYPDMYMVSEGGRAPQIHTPGGKWKDGRTGEVNVVSDVNSIGQLRSTPDPAGQQTIDRLERNSRVSLGLAAQWGGETSNALRTGRGIETMLAASTDPRIHELHDIVLNWMPLVGKAIFETWKAYWPEGEFVMDSQYPGLSGMAKFEPGKHFSDTTEVSFSYPIAGGDIQLTNIILLQQLGANAISLDKFRTNHPWIEDPAAEARKVAEERLEQIAMEALTQQAMGGQIPMEQLAMIEEEFRKTEGADIFSAIRGATEKLKAQQAAEVPETPEDMAAPPEMMPGMGGPTGPMGPAPEMAGPIAPPNGIEGLRELQNALAAGGRRVNGVAGPQ